MPKDGSNHVDIVKETWDNKTYQGAERQFYIKELYEY